MVLPSNTRLLLNPKGPPKAALLFQHLAKNVSIFPSGALKKCQWMCWRFRRHNQTITLFQTQALDLTSSHVGLPAECRFCGHPRNVANGHEHAPFLWHFRLMKRTWRCSRTMRKRRKWTWWRKTWKTFRICVDGKKDEKGGGKTCWKWRMTFNFFLSAKLKIPRWLTTSNTSQNEFSIYRIR